MSKITIEDVLEIVGNRSDYFSVRFTKRTTGDERVLNCQRGVRKHLKGGNAAYSFTDKGLISVWCPKEVGKHGDGDRGYRSFPADSVLEIKSSGKSWIRQGNGLVERDECS